MKNMTNFLKRHKNFILEQNLFFLYKENLALRRNA